MRRFEPILTAFFLATWIVALLALFGLVDSAGKLPAGLYGLFSFAAAGGWVMGNVYVVRAKAVPRILRRGLLLIYFGGPLGTLLLVRLMAPSGEQAAAPLVPFLSWAVFSVLFLVPVLLKRFSPPPPDLHIGGRDR